MHWPGEVDYSDGGKTTFSYTPTQLSQYRYQNASTYEDTETQYDGYGRVSRVAVANGQSSNPWYQTDTCYNAAGEVEFKSYSFQGAGFGQGKVCSGAGIRMFTMRLGVLPPSPTATDPLLPIAIVAEQ